MARRFFRSSINELEALFEQEDSNRDILLALHEELTHRKTERAGRLRTKVAERLVTLQSRGPFPEPESEEPPRSPSSDGRSGTRPDWKHPSSQPPPAPPEDFPKDGPSGPEGKLPPPPITNQPDDVLSAWTAMEVLSPQVYVRPEDLAAGDKSRVTSLREALPWERGDKSRPNYRLYHQVVLGSIKMEPAIGCLIER